MSEPDPNIVTWYADHGHFWPLPDLSKVLLESVIGLGKVTTKYEMKPETREGGHAGLKAFEKVVKGLVTKPEIFHLVHFYFISAEILL